MTVQLRLYTEPEYAHILSEWVALKVVCRSIALQKKHFVEKRVEEMKKKIIC